jgi:signal transduction histidine kinase
MRVASEQVKAIYELTGNLSATLSYERVIESILDIGMLGLHDIDKQNGLPGGAVLLFKEVGNSRHLYIAAFRNLSEEEQKMTFPVEGGVLAHALATVEPTVIGKPSDDEELSGLASWRRYQSVVVLPLRAGFELYGATVFCSEQRNAYRDRQLAFLGTLCNQATIALQNAQLYKQVREEKDRILNGEEDVRHWLARELHDGPTQTISALAMRLNYTRLLMDKDPSRVGEELAELEKMARRATKEIRTTLFKLRPLVLESQGLPGALEQYATRLKENGGTPLMLDVEQPMDRLDATVEGTIFAIIEEAVNNAQKYAEAQQIMVRLARFGDTLVVTVRDNGKGFDLKAVEASYDQRGSLGLVNMRERAELIGGNLEIDSKPGRGTTVTVAVPMKRAG